MTFWSRTARISVCLALLMMIMAILVEITPLGENSMDESVFWSQRSEFHSSSSYSTGFGSIEWDPL